MTQMKAVISRTCGLAICITAGLSAQGTAGHEQWDAKSAAGYLDSRMTWWMGWPSAARDHETFCISCHTALPYAMARPSMRAGLHEQAPSAIETKLVENVSKRVRMWDQVLPFYPDKKEGDPKTAESRGTESILNAVILASYNAPDFKLALDQMWAQQLKTGPAAGAWAWLQFHNSPWEGDSQYYGATLAALATGTAPAAYRESPEVRDGLKMLSKYLAANRESQTLMDRMILLWASTKLPGILTEDEKKAIATEAVSKQQPDGGFSLSSFVGSWKRRDNSPLETKGDGYATGVVAFVLQELRGKQFDPQINRSLAWMRANQDKTEGRWLAYSMNKQRDLSSDVGKFMSDAATAYAVMALERSNR